ncbi:hypothetical protein AAZX31_14G081100 [Glycine max]|nr:hypothetical protein JHK84_039568 [Glycine max]
MHATLYFFSSIFTLISRHSFSSIDGSFSLSPKTLQGHAGEHCITIHPPEKLHFRVRQQELPNQRKLGPKPCHLSVQKSHVVENLNPVDLAVVNLVLDRFDKVVVSNRVFTRFRERTGYKEDAGFVGSDEVVVEIGNGFGLLFRFGFFEDAATAGSREVVADLVEVLLRRANLPTPMVPRRTTNVRKRQRNVTVLWRHARCICRTRRGPRHRSSIAVH